MLQGESIVCFAPEPWHSMWRSRQQIMARLAKSNKVLFVEARPYLRTVLKRLTGGRIGLGELRKERLRRVGDNLYVYSPPAYAPISGKPGIERITGFLRTAGMRQAMRTLGMARPIVWLERPDMWNEAGKHKEKLLIYRIVDEYSAYNGLAEAEKIEVRKQEEYLLRRADLVLVTSEALLQSKRSHNSNVSLLPHGVDYSSFAEASASDWLPEELRQLPRPLLGYAGLVAARLDLGMLADLAIAHPYWSLVLVGQVNPANCEAEMSRLRELPNVHFIGQVDAKLVPYYVKEFDVGLIPYCIDEQSYNINPLKLLEYLACGKPVVSVDIPSARAFAGVVKVATVPGAFATLIEEALAETGGEMAARRRVVAAENTWEKRVELLGDLVEAALRRKGNGGRYSGELTETTGWER